MAKKKKKASDIFNASEPFLGKKENINEAFSQIEKINIMVNEYKDFWEKQDGLYPILHSINELDLGQFVDCSENSCYRGGFSIQKIISVMVSDGQTHREGSSNCIGRIGNSKGRRCPHKFKYKIEITYKNY